MSKTINLIVLICCAFFLKTVRLEDEDVVVACTEGLKPCVQVGDNMYILETKEKLSWYGCRALCKKNGAVLASIESADEMRDINNHFMSIGNRKNIWTSGNDIDKEGKFIWGGTGKPMVYKDWSKRQPDNRRNEDCVMLWLDRGKFRMNDGRCWSKQYCLCEVDNVNSNRDGDGEVV